MPPFESLKLVSGLLQAQTPPNEPEELTKGKKDLSDILVALAEKEKEIEASQDSPERKSERYTKIAEVLKTKVLPVLESWLTKYPEKAEGINKAIASIKALITKYEKLSTELKATAERAKASGNAGRDLAEPQQEHTEEALKKQLLAEVNELLGSNLKDLKDGNEAMVEGVKFTCSSLIPEGDGFSSIVLSSDDITIRATNLDIGSTIEIAGTKYPITSNAEVKEFLSGKHNVVKNKIKQGEALKKKVLDCVNKLLGLDLKDLKEKDEVTIEGMKFRCSEYGIDMTDDGTYSVKFSNGDATIDVTNLDADTIEIAGKVNIIDSNAEVKKLLYSKQLQETTGAKELEKLTADKITLIQKFEELNYDFNGTRGGEWASRQKFAEEVIFICNYRKISPLEIKWEEIFPAGSSIDYEGGSVTADQTKTNLETLTKVEEWIRKNIENIESVPAPDAQVPEAAPAAPTAAQPAQAQEAAAPTAAETPQQLARWDSTEWIKWRDETWSKNPEVPEINADDFEKFISEGTVIVEVGASWCNPCKVIRPFLREAATKYQGRIKFGSLTEDGDEDSGISTGSKSNKKVEAIEKKYDAELKPTILIFKNGKLQEKVVGLDAFGIANIHEPISILKTRALLDAKLSSLSAPEALQSLSPELVQLKSRFDATLAFHPGLEWTPDLQAKLEKMKVTISAMESAGHEPTVLKMGDEIYIVSGATESPDKNKNYNEAVGMATGLGVNLMTETQYRAISPSIKQLDVAGWTWLKTPEDILKRGWALGGYLAGGAVNVVPSAAGVRVDALGWRASLRVE